MIIGSDKTPLVYFELTNNTKYRKTCVKVLLSKRPKIGFQWEHSAILSTFIKLPFVIKIVVLSIFEWGHKAGFTAYMYFFFQSGFSSAE